jgi:D-alanyl-D-alanine carboxypeptidase/D-alanyl-D-alanine-endopeptidase (penicillin-binding protein 4)
LIADDSYFSGSAIPASWEWDDLQWYYGAEVSALPLNDNAIDLNIKPLRGRRQCLVQLQPFNTLMRITNRCTTVAAGTKRDLTVKKDLDQNVLVVSGSMPVGDKPFANYLTVSRPAELFVALVRQRLQAKGIVVTGQTRIVGAKEKLISAGASTIQPIEIARLESAPLSLIAAKT